MVGIIFFSSQFSNCISEKVWYGRYFDDIRSNLHAGFTNIGSECIVSEL